MTRILIVEDEKPAVDRLQKLIYKIDSDIQILAAIDSVEDAVQWIQNNPAPDIAFMDIQLADGQSFSIFDQVAISFPIIFTTAYDQYALKAFKVNSIDYLLKPIDDAELAAAWTKYKNAQSSSASDMIQMMDYLKKLQQHPQYKERFLIKKGDQFKYLTIREIAYFYAEDGLTFLVNQAGQRFIVDDRLDALEQNLNPRLFFRINRKFIIHEQAVNSINTHFNSRLKLQLQPSTHDEIIVSRDRVTDFKSWLND